MYLFSILKWDMIMQSVLLLKDIITGSTPCETVQHHHCILSGVVQPTGLSTVVNEN